MRCKVVLPLHLSTGFDPFRHVSVPRCYENGHVHHAPIRFLARPDRTQGKICRRNVPATRNGGRARSTIANLYYATAMPPSPPPGWDDLPGPEKNAHGKAQGLCRRTRPSCAMRRPFMARWRHVAPWAHAIPLCSRRTPIHLPPIQMLIQGKPRGWDSLSARRSH